MKNKMCAVSVVIPVLNGEKTLRNCLQSVINQDYEDYEIVVVNNNSQDNTAKIIDEFRARSNKIKIVFETKRTRGAARRKGELNSKGKIILMTDADCVVPKNWIREMIKPIVGGNSVAVQGLMKPIIKNYWTTQMQMAFLRHVEKHTHDKKADFLDTANCALKSSVLKDVGYSDAEIWSGNDLDLHIRLKMKGYNVYFKRCEVLHYHSDTLWKVFKKFFKREEWRERIRVKYNCDKSFFPKRSIEPKYRLSLKNVPFRVVQLSASYLGSFYAKVCLCKRKH